MKTDKSMKIKITAVAVLTALAIAAITLLAVFLPKRIANAANDKSETTTQVSQALSQIESLENQYQRAFDDNAELWEKYFAELLKLDELPDNFDEKAFIENLSVLTRRRKGNAVEKRRRA